MDMGQLGPLMWETPRSRVVRNRAVPDPAGDHATRLTEWTARPVGRLGRLLLSDVDTYLAFWAIVGSDGTDAGRAEPEVPTRWGASSRFHPLADA
jgi:hypothetical protein